MQKLVSSLDVSTSGAIWLDISESANADLQWRIWISQILSAGGYTRKRALRAVERHGGAVAREPASPSAPWPGQIPESKYGYSTYAFKIQQRYDAV